MIYLKNILMLFVVLFSVACASYSATCDYYVLKNTRKLTIKEITYLNGGKKHIISDKISVLELDLVPKQDIYKIDPKKHKYIKECH